MGRKCSVYGCNSGYSPLQGSEKIPIYKFPNEPDECRRWAICLPKKIDRVTKYMGICALHWPADTPLVSKSRFPTPVVPPSIFPCAQDELPSNSTSASRPTAKALSSRKADMDQHHDDFNEADKFEDSEWNPENCSSMETENSLEEPVEDTIEEMAEPDGVIIKITFLWCSYCKFTTFNKQDLLTHINETHMKMCPYCPFRSTSQTDVTKHIECEHKKRMQIDCLSNAETDIDPVSSCELCGFMSYSSEHLQKHTNVEHPGMFPKSSTKIIFKYISARVRQADYLFYSCLLNETCEGGGVLDSEPQFISTDIRIRGTPFTSKQEESFSYSLDQNYCTVPSNNIEFISNVCSNSTRDVSSNSPQNEIALRNINSKDNQGMTFEMRHDDKIINKSPKFPVMVSLLQKQVISEKPNMEMRIDSSNQLSEKGPDDLGFQNSSSDDDDDDDVESQGHFPSDQVKKNVSLCSSTSQEERSDTMTPITGELSAIHRHGGVNVDNQHVEEEIRCTSVQPKSLPIDFDIKSTSTLDALSLRRKVMRTLGGRGKFKCKLCDMSYTQKSALEWHMHWHTTKESLQKRDKERKDRQRFKKDLIKLEKKQRVSSKEIIRLSRPKEPDPKPVPKPEPEPCEVCGKLLMPASLRSHLQAHLGIRPYICKVCGRDFADKYVLKKHLKIVHSTERPHQCRLCEKNYKDLQTLKKHMRKHSGTEEKKEFNFKCTQCDKCYRTSDSLRYHMSIHTGEKPYLCNICGKHFRWRGVYHAHMNRHKGEKRFKCLVCGASFHDKKSQQMHLTTHQEKPFKCDTCLKGFRSHKMYQKHMEKQPLNCGNPQFNCSLCNKGFFRKPNLRRHERLVHRQYMRKPSQVQNPQTQKRPTVSVSAPVEIQVQPLVNSSSITNAAICNVPYSDALKESLCGPPPLHIQFSYDPPSNEHVMPTGPF